MSVLKSISKEKERRAKVHAMSIADAQQELTELRRELFDLRLQMTRGQVSDVRQFARTRKDIARLLYKLHMAQFAGDEEETAFVEAEEAPVAEADTEVEPELEADAETDTDTDAEAEQEEADEA